MSVRAPGSNAPLRRRTKKGLERLKKLTSKYVAEGMPEAEAKTRAQAELRDNPRRDWRAG